MFHKQNFTKLTMDLSKLFKIMILVHINSHFLLTKKSEPTEVKLNSKLMSVFFLRWKTFSEQ